MDGYWKGKHFSENHRRKISEATKGKSKGRLGTHLSKEICKKISETHKGIHHTEETKRKLSEINKGKHHSEETRQKISKALKDRCFSEEHRKKLSESEKGEKNHNWKGGIAPINIKIRQNMESFLWRKICLEKDKFTCLKCELHGGKLCIHHINNFADFPEVRTTIDNGIILCRTCHKHFHQIYGRRYNTKEQLKEFLKKGVNVNGRLL